MNVLDITRLIDREEKGVIKMKLDKKFTKYSIIFETIEN